MPTIALNNLPTGQRAVVFDVSKHNEDTRCRLLTMGIYPGIDVEILRAAPLGDPIQVRCGSTLISIRKQEAKLIEVEPCQ